MKETKKWSDVYILYTASTVSSDPQVVFPGIFFIQSHRFGFPVFSDGFPVLSDGFPVLFSIQSHRFGFPEIFSIQSNLLLRLSVLPLWEVGRISSFSPWGSYSSTDLFLLDSVGQFLNHVIICTTVDRIYLSKYTALVKRNHSVTMVQPMVERLRNWPYMFLKKS